MEEIVAKFEQELESEAQRFKEQANEVRKWDMILIENGQNLGRLYEQMTQAEQMRNQLSQNLGTIERSQADMRTRIEQYEDEADKVSNSLSGQRKELVAADQQRQDAFQLADNLNQQLKDLGSNLGSMITKINSLSSNVGGVISSENGESTGTENALAQITTILSSHISSLEWINSQAGEVDDRLRRMEEVSSPNNSSIRSSTNTGSNTTLGKSRGGLMGSRYR